MKKYSEEVLDAIKSAKGVSIHNGSLRLQFKVPDKTSAIRKSLAYPPTTKNIDLAVLTLANISYRAPYQLRHTFASQLLTAGCDATWLAAQMGHKNWDMISKIYGRWISKDNPEYAQKMADKLGQAY